MATIQGVPAPANYFFAVFMFVTPLWWCFSFYCFYQCREVSMIKNRGPWSVMFHTLAITCTSFLQMTNRAFGVRCGTLQIINGVCFFFLGIFLLERIVLLIMQFNIAVKASKYAEAQMKNMKEDVEFNLEDDDLLRNKARYNHGFISVSKLIVMLIILALTVTMVSLVAGPPYGALLASNGLSSDCVETIADRLNILNNGFFAIIALGLLESVRRLRHVRENYLIRRELKYLGFVAIAIFLGIVITSVVPSLKKIYLDSVLYHIILPIIMVYISLYMVAKEAKRVTGGHSQKSHTDLRSHASQLELETSVNSDPTTPSKQSRMTPKSPRSRNQMLIKTIHNEGLYSLFQKFMIQEFAIENLLFVKAVIAFEAMDPQSERALKAAKSIYKEFVKVDSKLCINIASSVRKNLDVIFSEELKDLRSTLFDEAKVEILNLIQGDSFRRFITTAEYKNYIAQHPDDDEDRITNVTVGV